MTKQVTVRLPEDLVQFVDSTVERGEAGSRAEVLAGALERERRRRIAERDAEILSQVADDDDAFDELAAFAAETPLDDLD
ncbi:MAG TPA: ribbon-helix-helix domain-containing protein [Chloroflexota bacterium]